MNTRDRDVVARLVVEIDRFKSGQTELQEIQSQLQSTLTLLERDSSAARDAIRLAEADVEEIRFTRLLDEQRPAAVLRLHQLHEALTKDLGIG